jgi:polysaccharide transporter, PST family
LHYAMARLGVAVECLMTSDPTSLDQHAINAQALDTGHLLEGLGARSANGVAISILGQGATVLLQIANAVVMARLLAPEDFGVAAMAMAVTGFIGLFTELGLSSASLQRRDLDQNTASALFQINVLCGLLGMLACFALAVPAAWALHDTRIIWAIVGWGCIVPLAATAVQHGALLARGMRWRTIQVIGVAALVMSILAGVLAALANFGYWAIIAAAGASAVTKLILFWIACPWRPSWVRDWSQARSSVKFGAYMTGFNFTLFLARQIDVLLIGWYWGAAATGYYTRAYQLMLLPLNAISGPLGAVFVPALSRLQSDPQRWRDAFMKSYLVAAAIGCAFASVFIVTADQVIAIVYGPGWQTTVAIFQWLSWSMICTFPMGAMAWAFVSLGDSRSMFHWGLVSLTVVAIVFALTVPFGPVVMAKAFCIALWLLTPVCFHFALKASPVSTLTALVEIVPLWIAAAAGAGCGLAIKGHGGLGLVGSLITETLVTLAVFAVVLAALAFRRPVYRRIAVDVWTLTSEFFAQRHKPA